MGQPNLAVVEIGVGDAFHLLRDDPQAQLIDVRTRAEWSFVGCPELPFRDEPPIFIEWQTFPQMQIDASFARRLEDELSRRGVGADAPLVFLCRSGARSRHAAQAMIEAGRKGRCLNVTEGFQGPLDAQGHRSRVNGWQAEGLPWRQS
jgi:rhodanese-related sulfurtransferase